MTTATALRLHHSAVTERLRGSPELAPGPHVEYPDVVTLAGSHAEVILNMWAAGRRQAEIAAAIPCDVGEIGRVLRRARDDGDRRAIRRQLFHKNFGSVDTREGIKHAQSSVLRRTRLGKRFPATREELGTRKNRSGIMPREARAQEERCGGKSHRIGFLRVVIPLWLIVGA
jgi:hypothetical protein